MFEAAEKKNVVLGITGSIAAYKSAELARQLVSWGYEVRAVMSTAATQFITPLTLQSITGNPVTTTFWEDGMPVGGISHIELADWADLLLVAPATADFIAKMSAGFADQPLLAIALATKAKIVLAPAMNVNMFEHEKTQENVSVLASRGVHFVDPEEGALACGWNGSGRLADPWEIFWHSRRALAAQDYAGKKVLIVTGPTREAIDPVRFISNRSSGKMGVTLAREAFRRGAEVTLVHGPARVKVPTPIRCVPVTTADEMRSAVLEYSFGSERVPDLIIMAAAVADYRPKFVADHKLKKGDAPRSIELEQNPDILSELGAKRAGGQRPALVGFAVETGELEDLIAEARRKLESKGADIIVGNFAQDAFDLDTNRVWLVDRNGRQSEVATTYKSRVSNRILDAALKF